MRLLIIWSLYTVRGILGRRRFMALTPPLSKKQYLLERFRSIHTINIRDRVDWTQMEHIFLCEEYDLTRTGRQAAMNELYANMIEQNRKPLIVDCGANIGLASKYFSINYPQARVVGVEPEPDNTRMAKRNNPSPLVSILQAGIASKAGTGRVIDMGSNQAFRVAEEVDGPVPFVTINSILETNSECDPFILKVDIEGFERDLFSANTEWIDRFPVIITELHDWMIPRQQVSHNFMMAMAQRKRDIMHFDGYVVSISDAV